MFQMNDTDGMFARLSDVKLTRMDEELTAEVQSTSQHCVRLYEAKLIHQFDHRYATFLGQSLADCEAGNAREITSSGKGPETLAVSRYFIPRPTFLEKMEARPQHGRWLLGYREITNATNERTIIAAIIPLVAAGRKIPQIYLRTTPPESSCLLAALNSFIVDFVARCKLSSTSIWNAFLEQLPVPSPSFFHEAFAQESRLTWISSRVLELSYTANDLNFFARDCAYDGPPFLWDDERRFLLRCELDAAFFHFYGIAR